jgi:hypothetical protein
MQLSFAAARYQFYCPSVTFVLNDAWPLHANAEWWVAPWESTAELHLNLPPHANVSETWSATVESIDVDSGEATFRLSSYFTNNFGTILEAKRLVNWTDVEINQCGNLTIADRRPRSSGALDAQPLVAVLLRAGAAVLSPGDGATLSGAVARSIAVAANQVEYVGSHMLTAPALQLGNSSDSVAAALLQLPSQDSIAKLAQALRRRSLPAGAVSAQLAGTLLEAEKPNGLDYEWVNVTAANVPEDGGDGGLGLAAWIWAPVLIAVLALAYAGLRWRRRAKEAQPPINTGTGQEPLIDAATAHA